MAKDMYVTLIGGKDEGLKIACRHDRLFLHGAAYTALAWITHEYREVVGSEPRTMELYDTMVS